MSIKINKIQLFVLCLFIFLSTSIHARQQFNDNLIEFSLSIQNHSSKLEFATSTDNVKFDQLGISWHETFSHYFQAGLEVGYIEMSHVNNPIASAQFTSGQYAGVLFRFLPVDNSNLSLILNLDYRYNKTEGTSTTQKSQFAWHETLLSSEIQFHPGDKVSLFLAAEYLFLDGEQRDSSSTTQIRPFSESQQEGYRVGLDLIPYHTGIIRFEWFSGFNNGGALYFKRKF